MWEAEPRPLSPEEVKRRSERLEKFRKFMEGYRLAPIVDEAMPYNRCFPPEGTKQMVCSTWPSGEDV